MAMLIAPSTLRAAVLTGTVIGDGARPIAGATVEVVHGKLAPSCAATTAADGTFSLSCDVTGRYPVRAVFGDLRPWQIDDVELGPDVQVHLNFMLTAATVPLPGADAIATTSEAAGFWSRRVPNPVVAAWQGQPITLRFLAILVAPMSFLMGALTMLALGRRFGIETRRLSPGEVGDMVLNPHMPVAGEHVTPVAVVGARGASATVSYGADEIVAALRDRRYGLLFVALVIAPGFFALFSFALALAMLIGQEAYLLYGMLLVPAGFLLTPLIIGIQALGRLRAAA